MTRRLDITRDVCPMTTVKVGMALAKLAHGGELEELLKKEALTKVVSSLKADGHRIAAAERREEIFVLHVAKGGGGAGRSEDGDNSWCGGEALHSPDQATDHKRVEESRP